MMETTITTKQELIDWISTIENKETLMILQGVKHEATFNFAEEWNKGIPAEEARRRSIESIRKMWKKQ